jgi:hypothetical protein
MRASADLPSDAHRDTVGRELAMLGEHLLRKREGAIEHRGHIRLCLR